MVKPTKPMASSYILIWVEGISSTNLALLTAKKPARKAEINPIKTAQYSWLEKSPDTKYIPATTINPKENSTHENFFFIISGSSQATCNVVVDKQRMPKDAVDH